MDYLTLTILVVLFLQTINLDGQVCILRLFAFLDAQIILVTSYG